VVLETITLPYKKGFTLDTPQFSPLRGENNKIILVGRVETINLYGQSLVVAPVDKRVSTRHYPYKSKLQKTVH